MLPCPRRTRLCAVRPTGRHGSLTSEPFVKPFTSSETTVSWMHRIRHLTAVGLLGTGIIHVQQWAAGYDSVPVTGTLFLLQGIAAIALAGWLYVDEEDLVAPVAAAGLMVASLVALGIAFTGVFINVAERVLRPATFLSIVTELVALGGAATLVRWRLERRHSAPAAPRRRESEAPVLVSAFHER